MAFVRGFVSSTLIRELTSLEQPVRLFALITVSQAISYQKKLEKERKERNMHKKWRETEGSGNHKLTKNKTNLKYILFKVFRLVKTK